MAKHKTKTDYESDISNLHHQLPDTSIEKKIERRVKRWMELAPIRVQVANNEQLGWTSEMIGYPTEIMETKKDTGINQVGDYHGIVATSTGDRYIDIVIERKSINDLYGTLVPEDNRARFYREISRFESDKRFNTMMILVEGSFTDFILYTPMFDGKTFDYARKFDTNKNNAINEKKFTILSDLLIREVPIIFCDSAAFAARLCGRIFRERVKKNYAHILGLQ